MILQSPRLFELSAINEYAIAFPIALFGATVKIDLSNQAFIADNIGSASFWRSS